MISFPCVCGGHRFDVSDDEAGGLVQCPRCSRLVDVPTLSELPSLDSEGLLKVAEDKPTVQRGRLRELQRAFGRNRVDESGNEIDMRQTFDDLRRAGVNERRLKHEEASEKPKYDPMTGELVEEFDLKPVAPVPVIPLKKKGEQESVLDALGEEVATGRQRPLGYVTKQAKAGTEDIPSLAMLPVKLFEPINLMVMLFIVMVTFFGTSLAVPLSGGMFIVALVVVLPWVILLAHYANCVDELGPAELNELPRPLRHLELAADILNPFVRAMFTLMVSYGPAAVFAVAAPPGPVRFVGTGVLTAAGALIFPAMALVFCASGYARNLRPDRLLGTVSTIGAPYLIAVAVCFFAVLLGFGSTGAMVNSFQLMMGSRSSLNTKVWFTTSASTIVVGVYVCHLAAWMLGVLYRRHQHEFPWYFEEQERARNEHKRLTALAKIEAARRANTALPNKF